MNVLLISGHGAGDPGAVHGIYKESEQTRLLTTEIYNRNTNSNLNIMIYPVSENAYSDYVHGKLVTSIKQYRPLDLILEIHFNASAAHNASGSLAYYYGTSIKGLDIANDLTREISESMGISNRKVFNDPIFSVCRTGQNLGIESILLETCFIDRDMLHYSVTQVATVINRVLYKYSGGFEMTEKEFETKIKEYLNSRIDTPQWSEEAMQFMVDKGLYTEYKGSKLVTRAELATVIQRLYSLLEG